MASRVSPGMDVVRFVTRGINLKTTGGITIGPVLRTTQKFIIQAVIVHVTVATSFTVSPTFEVHGNFGSGNVSASGVLANIATDSVNNLTLAGSPLAWSISTGGAGIIFNITVGATATTATCDVHLVGYYV